MGNNSSSSGGVGFSELLQVVFITLKLIGIINWGWFYVLLPTIIPIGFVSILMIVFVVLRRL